VPLGLITSTVDDPWRAGRKGSPFRGVPRRSREHHRRAAMSVPLHTSSEGLPIGVHALGRFGADDQVI